MAMTQDRFESLVRGLERYAAAHPAGYKVRVVLLAILGYAYVLAVILLAIALMGLLGVVLVVSRANILAVKLGAKFGLPLLLLLGVILRALWVRLEEPAGFPLSRKDFPRLFQAIDEMRARLKGPRIHQVLLDDDFNAGATQIPRMGLLGWPRNYLTVGLPLMQALSSEQFLAVVAHEYGHLSGAHGRLGAWIYRIRMTWYRLMETLGEQRHWGKFVFERFLNWYAPFFNAYSFVLARSDEYAADRCAADLVGADQTAAALANVHVRGQFLDESFWPGLYRQADERPEPAVAPYQAMGSLLRSPFPEEKARESLAQALRVETDLDDTHPALRDRLSALRRG
jgi:Zn-dependent protease with chaperone function